MADWVDVRRHQAWLGNIPAEYGEADVINFLTVFLGSWQIEPPYKVVLRESTGENVGFKYGVASWRYAEHCERFIESAKFSWPGHDMYCVIK